MRSKFINGYDEKYIITDDGRVISLKGKQKEASQ